MPGRLVFSTTADGASSPTERMRIDSAGRVGIGGAPAAGVNVSLNKAITGSVSSYGILQNTTIQSDVTSFAALNATGAFTQAAAFTLTNLRHYSATQGTIGAGSTVSNQYAYYADSSLIGATNNYGFYSDIASGTGRYNFYAAGTANNYFAGSVGIGFVPTAGQTLFINKTITGSINSTAVRQQGIVQSDATNTAYGFDNVSGTQAAAFTLSDYRHFNAQQGTFGAGSTVTNQFGFRAESTLIGATNNYGFYGNIASGTGRYNFYAAGTAANVFVGATSLGGAVGSESLRVTPVASAVNYLNALGAATGGNVSFAANGSDTNIGVAYTSKGTGSQLFYSNNYGSLNFSVSHTASAVNYLQVTGSALTFPTLSAQGSSADVSPVITSKGTGAIILQTGNLTQFVINHTASAVNYLQVRGAAAGGVPLIQSAGSDADIPLTISAKGTGYFNFQNGGGTQFFIANTASAVNYFQVSGGVTGGSPIMYALGSDTDVSAVFSSKGAGNVLFRTGTGTVIGFVVSHTASAVNYLQVTGSASTTPTLSAQGSGADLDISLTPKGTGNVRFGTYTAGVIAQAGYISIKDAAGNTRRLLVG